MSEQEKSRHEFRPESGGSNDPEKKADTQSGYGKNSGQENDNLVRNDNKNDPIKGPNA